MTSFTYKFTFCDFGGYEANADYTVDHDGNCTLVSASIGGEWDGLLQIMVNHRVVSGDWVRSVVIADDFATQIAEADAYWAEYGDAMQSMAQKGSV